MSGSTLSLALALAVGPLCGCSHPPRSSSSPAAGSSSAARPAGSTPAAGSSGPRFSLDEPCEPTATDHHFECGANSASELYDSLLLDGDCQDQLGHPVAAHGLAQESLRLAIEDHDPNAAKRARELLARSQAHLVTVKLTTAVGVGYSVAFDGGKVLPAAANNEYEADPGAREIVVRMLGSDRTYRARVCLHPGEKRTLAVTFTPPS